MQSVEFIFKNEFAKSPTQTDNASTISNQDWISIKICTHKRDRKNESIIILTTRDTIEIEKSVELYSQ